MRRRDVVLALATLLALGVAVFFLALLLLMSGCGDVQGDADAGCDPELEYCDAAPEDTDTGTGPSGCYADALGYDHCLCAKDETCYHAHWDVVSWIASQCDEQNLTCCCFDD